jgi:flagellar hook-length control protein FliK
MDTSFSFLPTNPLLPSVSDSTGSALGADPPALGGEFSTLLTGQMFKAERQLFAAQSLSGTGLQVLPLGSKIKLITSDDPLPDMASLAAFARTQGIDEAAVQSLFAGQNISVGAPVLPQPVNVQFGQRNRPELGLESLVIRSDDASVPIRVELVETRGQAQGEQFMAPKAGSMVSEPKTPTSPAQNRPRELLASTAALSSNNPLGQLPLVIAATTTAETAAVKTVAPVLANTNIASWMPLRASENRPSELPASTAALSPINPLGQMPLVIAATTTAETAAVKTVSPVLANTNMASWMPLVVAATTTAETAAVKTVSPVLANTNMASWMPLRASALSDVSEVTNSNAVSAEVAIQDAMRLTITAPAQAITKRLTQMSGSTEQSTWASLMAGNTLPPTPLAAAKTWETLQLDIPDDLLISLLEGSQESTVDATTANSPGLGMGQATASTSPSSSAPTASASALVSAQVEHRLNHQQQLADKLGQALAERLVDQMERGQWKIEMRLRPESLGQIDVELKMHAGGLDALFSAENSVTRELIALGSGKLKDALTQTGMAVASVWVSGDQSRQSGGNSTPRNGYKPSSGGGREREGVEDVAAKLKDEPTATNGLNLWA